MAQPEPDETPTAPNALTPAIAWVRARGGCVACARDVLKISAGKAAPRDIRAALKKAKAPPEVFGLIWREVWEATNEAAKLRAQVDEGPEEWWNR